MESDSGGDVAVLTGDLVGSSGLSTAERQKVHETFRRISDELRRRHGSTVPYEIDVFRGDSWQLLIAEPAPALRVALYVRSALQAHLRSLVDTRVTIGVGRMDFLPEDGVSTGDGPAFRLSGAAIEALEGSHRMGFDSEERHRARCLDAVVKLVDFPATWWTWRQALAVNGSLLDETQEEIGLAWPDGPISQQAVAQHLARAGWHAVETAVSYFEYEFKGC